MTIASQTSRITYTGDGVTTAFAVPFYFQLNADIVVYLQDPAGNAVLQILGTNYNLTGATIPAGGTATFTVAPPTAYVITIYRDPPMTQTASYNNNDPFPAKSHEAALDKALTISQRTRDLSARSLRLSDAEPAITTQLASVASRKNRLLGFDTNGALVYVIGPTFVGNTSTGVAEVDSRATAQTVIFSVSVNIVQTHGGAVAGDGGGLDYVRGTIASPTPFQDAGGVYWTPATVQPLNVSAIAAASIAYSKIQNVAASSLLGNPTGAPATASEITLPVGFTFAGQALVNSIIVEPQGYLTLSSGVPIIAADVQAGAVFYTPLKGNLINIYNGSVLVLTAFSELTLSLVASHLASNHYDCFVINDAGTIRLVTGPAWSNASAGVGARGTGAGTTELQRLNGLWTNKVSMTARYGATTTAVAANQGTYVGSIFIDTAAGSLTCHRAWGKDRRWGVWNAYNRANIFMQEGDSASPSSSATYPAFTAYNADATNRITIFTGLPEEQAYCVVNMQTLQGAINRSGYAAIGLNSTTAATGTVGKVQGIGSDMRNTTIGYAFVQPALGINVIQQLMTSDGVTVTYQGGQAFNMMTAAYRG